MEIQRIVSDLLKSNMYIVTERDHALLIDPCLADIPSLNAQVDVILVTHEHYDHISGVEFWRDKTGAKFLCSERCNKGCRDPKRNLSHYFEAFCELQTWIEGYKLKGVKDFSCAADETYQGKKVMQWQGHQVEMFECPGHSAGGQGILIDGKLLFSGDSLIKGYKTVCNMPGGNRKEWLGHSLPMLRMLDREIVIYPGHFDKFKISEYDDGAGGAL